MSEHEPPFDLEEIAHGIAELSGRGEEKMMEAASVMRLALAEAALKAGASITEVWQLLVDSASGAIETGKKK